MRKNPDLGLLVLRLGVAGIMFALHGWQQKLANFEQLSWNFPDPLHVGSWASLALTVFAEAGCALLIVLGLATRLAALPLMFTMGVVVFKVKAGAPFTDRELPVLFLIAFATLFFTGPGEYSLDAPIARRWYRHFPALDR